MENDPRLLRALTRENGRASTLKISPAKWIPLLSYNLVSIALCLAIWGIGYLLVDHAPEMMQDSRGECRHLTMMFQNLLPSPEQHGHSWLLLSSKTGSLDKDMEMSQSLPNLPTSPAAKAFPSAAMCYPGTTELDVVDVRIRAVPSNPISPTLPAAKVFPSSAMCYPSMRELDSVGTWTTWTMTVGHSRPKDWHTMYNNVQLQSETRCLYCEISQWLWHRIRHTLETFTIVMLASHVICTIILDLYAGLQGVLLKDERSMSHSITNFVLSMIKFLSSGKADTGTLIPTIFGLLIVIGPLSLGVSSIYYLFVYADYINRYVTLEDLLCCMLLIITIWRQPQIMGRFMRIVYTIYAEYLGFMIYTLDDISICWRRFDKVLVMLGLHDPPVKAGKKRLFWTCRCGHKSFDDFAELRPGAVKQYENQLREHLGSQSNTTGSNLNPVSRGFQQLGLMFRRFNNAKGNNQPSLPQYNTTVPSSGTSIPVIRAPSDNLYLLICTPHRKYATKLVQPDLKDIHSDQAFFKFLQASYRGLRGRFRSAFSLKTLKTIKFVKFEMYKSELVDIRKQDDIPPEDRKDEYLYRPIPAEIVPPIGDNHMMHLFTHPEDADNATAVCFDRIPKKVKDRLFVCRTRGTGLGWGIYFIEGWHYNIICLVAFTILLLASLIFLICWSVFKQDIQGASGVAAYTIAFITLLVGSLQAMFESG